jgi:arylsulfatase A-like enzyme
MRRHAVVRMTDRTAVGVVLLVVALAGPGLQPHDSSEATVPAQQASRPNVLIILTDDQRYSTLDVMPDTRAWLRAGGTRFTRGFVTTPLCCPSRSSIFTGRYAHNHGVRTNPDARRLLQSSTIQRYLRGAGYRTAIAGRYLPSWPLRDAPPHFDRWATFPNTYVDPFVNDNGASRVVRGYSVDLIADYATRFLQGFETDDARPWFLHVATNSPHDPYTAEAAYANAPVPDWAGNPAAFETDRSDKPPWVQGASASFANAKALRVKQLRTLMSVDDLVGRLFQTLSTLGEGNTLAFFLSDNGFFWGEHKISATKRHPYTASVQVPFFMRWPGHVPSDVADHRLALNVDVAPTILHAAGIAPDPTLPPDGRSLLGTARRSRVLLEYWLDPGLTKLPTWASTRAGTFQYVEYYDTNGAVRFREYYNLAADPWQLENLLADGDPGNDPNVAALSAQLARDRGCRGTAGAAACP